MNPVSVILRLTTSCILGGIIGLERESSARPAGFRTHILVCVGSTLITIASIHGFPDSESARIAAQIVSGIGFLGAGTILREGMSVRGLTTAASLWVVAAIGLAVGADLYLAAFITTLFVFISLSTFGLLEGRLIKSAKTKRLVLQAINKVGLLGRIASILGSFNINIEQVKLKSGKQAHITIDMILFVPEKVDLGMITQKLLRIEAILSLEFY